MVDFTRQALSRVAGAIVIALAYATTGNASVIQMTVDLPPVSGAYALGGTCLGALGRCTQNALVRDFEILSSTVAGGSEVVKTRAVYSADIHVSDGGLPGARLGQLLLVGTADFLYVGRDPAVNPLGTFVTELTDFRFAGMLNGNTFEVARNPAHTSGGWTTIVPAALNPNAFDVTGALEIFALYSFNGSPFLPAPPRTAELEDVPEPASMLLGGVALAGAAAAWRRRRAA